MTQSANAAELTHAAEDHGAAAGVPAFGVEQTFGHDVPGVWRRLLRDRRGLASLVTLLLVVLISVVGPYVARYSVTDIDPLNQFQGASWDHLLGTDLLGRDNLSRTMAGGRLALFIAFVATAFALVVGGVWGAIAAQAGGVVEAGLMRLADAMLAIPLILLALILVAAFGTDLVPLSIVLGILHTPWTARIVRSAVRSELVSEYCIAARSFGTGRARLLFREVLPNVVPTLLVQASLVAASVMLAEAALSFLGLGTSPPEASWGALLLAGYQEMGSSLWLVIVPGVALVVTVMAVNTLGERLQAVLDPRRGDLG
jgi:peptide/nickel transport system permease protein